MNYYNEFDPFAAQWLRNLIAENLIAPGEVDERDIRDVKPSELNRYTQHHFFAGIGGWSYALRLAGWPDDRSVWTGSCPCQPFSAAGKGAGFADERHLWPAWHHLIREWRPSVIFGEQVDKAIDWLDLVQADLEGEGYSVGSLIAPAAGIGAPHQRHRLWFVAESNGWHTSAEWQQRSGKQRLVTSDSVAGELEHSNSAKEERLGRIRISLEPKQETGRPCYANPWEKYELIRCADGKSRSVEPGTFPLAHGVPNRVGTLRGYGNAIVPQVAAEVIRAYMESMHESA